ncbi:bestrophin family protein [Spirosoma montaniterrae]|uniref:Multidrug transporter n=1 Tax=Spirosoma montaniterrae TaxID=1178516 RepID=A0A1P9WYZ7_9BACT|nr:bestrophin family ion channel [Spirosoma montaniterrae]AQG80600.1 multidrug transporter [Spirosoma montaniterrae]
MHAGKRYTFTEFVFWTRRDIYKLLLLSVVPTALYHFFGYTFLALTWVPIALIGTAVAFIVGFKNNATYSRLWEARQIYGSIINTSRAFGVMVRDYLRGQADAETKVILYRHIAWLTALRYQLREPRIWESTQEANNIEYSHLYKIPERETKLDDELQPYLSDEERVYVLTKKNRATQIMALQSKHINELRGLLNEFQLMQLQTGITSFYDHQGRAERIKNFPYPRNFSSIATILLYLFVVLVPFGLLKEFNSMGKDTFLEGYSVWFNVPFATLLTWVFVALDRVGESSANPFEGGANDVPISNISRTIEIDLRDMLDETDLPAPIAPVNNILM